MSIRRFVTVLLSMFVMGSVAFAVYRQTDAPAKAAPSQDVAVAPGAQLSGSTNAGAPAPSREDQIGDPSTIETQQPSGSNRRIVAMYFHGDVRCKTCRTIETYAREAIDQGFPERVANGTVVFLAVNVDRPENRHFVTDYKLVTRTVVVAEEVDGTVTRWNSLNGVWQLVGDHDAYLDYVRGAVNDLLETV